MKKLKLNIGQIINNYTILKGPFKIKNKFNYQNYYLVKCNFCGKELKYNTTYINFNKSSLHFGCSERVNKKHNSLKFSPKEASFRCKASEYKSSANNRGLTFDLNKEETIKFLKGNCYYCGIEPSLLINMISKTRLNNGSQLSYPINDYNIYCNGIDRVDNTKGYSIDNCVSCCKDCNIAKLTKTKEEFRNWIIKVYKNFILNNK